MVNHLVDALPTPAPPGPTVPVAVADLHWLNLLFIAIIIPAVAVPLCIIIASRLCCRVARKRWKRSASLSVGDGDAADEEMAEGEQGEAVNGLNTEQKPSNKEKGGGEWREEGKRGGYERGKRS